MGCHNLIEPSPIMQIQMSKKSTIYQSYHQFLKIHPKDHASQLTKDVCLNTLPLSIEEQLARLEFLYMNDYHEEMNTLVHSPYYSHEAAFLYRVLMKRRQNLLTYKDLQWLESITFHHPSIQCLHYFIIVYAYYDLKQYSGFDKYIDLCQQALHKINEPLFHYFMKLRLDEAAFHHYWKANHTLLARKYAYKFINKVIAPSQLCKMNHHLALSHLYDSYEKSYDYALAALAIAEKSNLAAAISSIRNHTIPFICAFHNQTDNITSPDPVETAHLAIAENKFAKAKEILSALDYLTPFQQTYLGVATADRKMLLDAHTRFTCDLNDFFFAKLPLLYLKRIPEE
ncbi:AimR family lysis-lysogeny pheromone receptor [Halobacillus sp. A5]|uniref:AimR family lysis-lysogeny pheromone receptor n=1 Tax=Halobacillus sp. A5 TaxID=2880263 RepID=UPI0020A655C7|nr:AimR family lysis-lysogeny pheromone receptor [Halobacillus sp. A5]MCP3027987.1 AimR family lysis-lysogeny pheromone receptor [Halobacillus sp. A5]